MSKLPKVCFMVALVMAALLLPSKRADAVIRCAAQRYTVCASHICCRFTCVYCEDTLTGEILSENCEADLCWSLVV
jgi:hypothetical protein